MRCSLNGLWSFLGPHTIFMKLIECYIIFQYFLMCFCTMKINVLKNIFGSIRKINSKMVCVFLISWSTWEQIWVGLDIFQISRRPSLWQKATAGSNSNYRLLTNSTQPSRSHRLPNWPLVLFDPERWTKAAIKCCLRCRKAGANSTEQPLFRSCQWILLHIVKLKNSWYILNHSRGSSEPVRAII